MKQKLILICLVMGAFLTGFIVFSFQQYDFTTLDQKKVSLKDFEDEYVVINYFAEWCAPCLKEIPELNDFDQSKPEDVHLFAISYDNLAKNTLIELRQKYNMQFDLITHVETQLPFNKPEYLPATFIILPDMSVKGPLLGEVTADVLNSAIAELR